MGGAHVGDHHGHQQRVGALRSLLDEPLDLALQRLQPAHAAGHDGADAVGLRRHIQIGVRGGALGGAHGVAREQVEAPHLTSVDVGLGLEVLDLGGEVHAVVGVVEAGDLAHAGLAGQQAAPHLVDVAAQRRHHTHAGDDHSSVCCCHRSLTPPRWSFVLASRSVALRPLRPLRALVPRAASDAQAAIDGQHAARDEARLV